MLNRNALRIAFRNVVIPAVPSLASNQWAWEGENFTPPAPTTEGNAALWVRETLQVATEDQTSSNLYQSTGIYVLDVFGPKGRGTEAIENIALMLAESFHAPAGLVSGATLEAAVDNATRAGIITREKDAWSQLPVRMAWRAYTNKATPLVRVTQVINAFGATTWTFTKGINTVALPASLAGFQVSYNNGHTWVGTVTSALTFTGSTTLSLSFDNTGFEGLPATHWRVFQPSGVTFIGTGGSVADDTGSIS